MICSLLRSFWTLLNRRQSGATHHIRALNADKTTTVNQQHESPVCTRRTNRSTQTSQEEKCTDNRPASLSCCPSWCVRISQWLILHVSCKPLINGAKKTQSFSFTTSALRKHNVNKSSFKLWITHFIVIFWGSEICTTIRGDYRNSSYLLFLQKHPAKSVSIQPIGQSSEVWWRQCLPRIDRLPALCDVTRGSITSQRSMATPPDK